MVDIQTIMLGWKVKMKSGEITLSDEHNKFVWIPGDYYLFIL